VTAAQCPTCGQSLTVRSDDRLPRHWASERARLAGDPQCPSSQEGTRHWPDQQAGKRTVRIKNPRRTR